MVARPLSQTTIFITIRVDQRLQNGVMTVKITQALKSTRKQPGMIDILILAIQDLSMQI